MVTLAELEELLGGRLLRGDPAARVTGVAPLQRASSSELAFVAEKKYVPGLRDARAGCVLLREAWAEECPVPVLCVDDPYLAYARASRLFEDAPDAPGVHPTAVVDPSVRVPATVRIGAHAVIEANVELGDSVVVGPGCFVGARVSLGAGTRLMPNVTLYHDVTLGERCRVHSSTVIGADGFGFARRPNGWERIAQLGRVLIGDDVDIGASVTIDRGALDDTVIASDVIIDDQVHVAHNCRIGARTALAGCVGIAGSVTVGEDCTLAGQVGVSGHLEICDNVHIAGQARVTRAVVNPGAYSSGTPLEPTRQWARNAVRFTQLEALQRRVVELEEALASLQAGEKSSDSGAG
ncbi:MAG: UDP-3-O-(3-hydroxymyristoyl)glucosamine N-acyltransferase [Pseudomonadota bacterium]